MRKILFALLFPSAFVFVFIGITRLVSNTNVPLAAAPIVAAAAMPTLVIAPTPTAIPTAVPTPTPRPIPTRSSEEIKRLAPSVAYDKLARNTEQFVGRIIYVRGEVIQVIEGEDRSAWLRVNMTKGDYGYSDTIGVYYTGPRILEDDIIDIYARVDGRISYTSTFGIPITLPEVTALVVEVVKE